MDDNSIYRQLFFEETDDHLQQLNDHVLALESNPEDRELLNHIFRSAHTLKGMAATMGYDVMTQLTHKLENIFELFKTEVIPVTSTAVSLIFKALDKLSQLVEDLRAEKELSQDQISELLLELEAFSGQEESAKEGLPIVSNKRANPLEIHFSAMDSSDRQVIEQAAEEGYQAFGIAVRLEEDSMLKGPRAFLIMEKLEQSGDILHTEPNAEELEAGNFATDFTLLYLTKDAENAVKKQIENNSEVEAVVIEPLQTAQNELSKPEEQSSEKIKAAAAQTPSASTIKKQNQSIRVDVDRLDHFLDLVSELVVYRNQLEDVSHRAKMDEIKGSLDQVSRLTSELQDLVLKIRMQQVSVVFSRFPRMMRDLANELHKEFDFIVAGEETELDKTVVSELSEPLVHLLRNSADHGIEDPGVRKELGKASKGTVKLTAAQEGNRVLITIQDDGKGLDPLKIKASAEKKGINTEGMTEEELQQLIFHPGFSTAKEVTNISGRGVGLDVVQTKINDLGGTIELKSQLNAGTSFIIKLPLTLSIIQALLVKIGSEVFAIPLSVVERVAMIEESEITATAQQEVYRYQQETIPIIRTAQLLNIQESPQSKKYLIIVKIDQQHYGILSDALIGQQEIVIKKIDPVLRKINKYQGATILGNGSIALILDVNTICQEKQSYLQ